MCKEMDQIYQEVRYREGKKEEQKEERKEE